MNEHRDLQQLSDTNTLDFPEIKSLSQVLEMKLPPLRFLIDDILPETGTTLIAGPPKIGKSYTLLQMLKDMLLEKNVAAYYFAGEDGFRRIQTRAIQLGLTQGSLWLHCGLENPISRADYLDYISRWLEKNSNCKVLFLDTMEKVIIPKQKREYGDWVSDLQPWNELAKDKNVQIVMVHHTNKGENKGIESILGSTGIAASFETLMIMQRDSNNITLQVIGKDVNEATYELESLEVGYKIGRKIIGNELKLGEKQDKVLQAIRNNPGITTTNLSIKLGDDISNTSKRVRKLDTDGLIDKAKDGNWPLK